MSETTANHARPVGPPSVFSRSAPLELLQAYRPYLRYDSRSVLRAVSAASIVDNPGNCLVRGKDILASASGVPVLSLSLLAGDASVKPKGKDRLKEAPDKLADACRMQADSRYADRAYGRFVERDGRTYLQYWLWFYFWPDFMGSSTGEEGAWRLVQVELDRDERPDQVVAGAVGGPSIPWGAVQ
jgi:hypothetical protein